jgi:hypothetical protein
VGVAGQSGVMSGVLNNLSVAIGLLTGFLPSIATDIANFIGRNSSLQERSRAGVFLAAKLALVIVIGFAIYQEFQQHIIFNTEIAKQEATKKAVEAHAMSIRPGDFSEGMCKAELNAYGLITPDEIRAMTPSQKAELHKAKCTTPTATER